MRRTRTHKFLYCLLQIIDVLLVLPEEEAGKAEDEKAGEDVEHVVHGQPHHQPTPSHPSYSFLS